MARQRDFTKAVHALRPGIAAIETTAELNALSFFIKERWAELSRDAIRTIAVDSVVDLTLRSGRKVRCIVTRRNDKTLTVEDVASPMSWRAAASLLTVVTDPAAIELARSMHDGRAIAAAVMGRRRFP